LGLASGRCSPDDIHKLFVTGDDVVFDLILSDAPPDLVEVSRPSDFAARPKLPALAAAAKYLRSRMSIIDALPRPGIQPLGARHS